MKSPSPAVADPDAFVRVHFGFELRVLLCSATTWKARSDGLLTAPPFLMDMAQDSVFLHARNLYELMAVRTEHGRKLRDAFGLTVFLPSPLVPMPYWGALHERAVHLSPYRPFEATGKPDDELPGLCLEFATDVLRMWDLLAGEPEIAHLVGAIEYARDVAVGEAVDRAMLHGMAPLFS
jgi:hypothetical protein